MDRNLKKSGLNRAGSSLIEILIALSFVSLSIAGSMQIVFASQKITQRGEGYMDLKNAALTSLLYEKEKKFDELRSASSTSRFHESMGIKDYDNYTKELKVTMRNTSNQEFSLRYLFHDFNAARAAENCEYTVSGDWTVPQVVGSVDIGMDNAGTGVVVRGAKVYLSADSGTQAKEDLFVIDVANSYNPQIVSKINTGPGIRSIVQTGRYVYAANTSVNAQLQIIDVFNMENPFLVAEFKLPHPDASTTPGIPRSIYFKDDVIYLGTTKNTGKELHLINVSNPLAPQYIAGIETDTQVSGIEIIDNILYLATPTIHQVRAIDVNSLSSLNAVSLSGWQTQEGKSLYRFINELYVGRSVGGFNNKDNHELFSFNHSTTTSLAAGYASVDVASSVNALIVRSPYIFAGTSDPAKEFQVWDSGSLSLLTTMDLVGQITDVTCGGSYIYAALQNSTALVVLSGKHE
jgi:hypothetical protein